MLQNVAYCPILHTRIAEIKGLYHLSAASKDRLFPIIVGRPWPNANHLSRSWEKVGEAFGNRRFALDLDRTRQGWISEKAAATEFDALFDDASGYANYYALVASIPTAIPVLRLHNGQSVQFEAQLSHIEALDRGVVVRIEYRPGVDPLPLVNQIISNLSDVAIVIDAGWTNDLLSRELWASQIIQHAYGLDPEVELVVAGSSFPDAFTKIATRGVAPVTERFLYGNLVRNHNYASLVYGDWGSTRPPSDPTPMGNIPLRIDLPASGEWIFFRQDRDLEEEYSQIAARIIADPSWPADLSIWGTYIIGCTANGQPGAIRSLAGAAAARINIHLHRQATYGANGPVSDGDEPFTDD